MKNNHTQTNNYIFLPGLMLIAFLGHISALKNHLVSDSWVFVVPRSFAETFGYFFKSIIPHEWEAFWLRPIPMFVFRIDNIIWPGTEWGPHLTNIVFHVLNVWLIWTLIQFIYGRSKTSGSNSSSLLPAIIACLVYGLHPLNVGAVAWVAARFDIMSLSFGLIGMLAWFKWDAGEKIPAGIFGICFIFLCAILSKEQAVIFPVVCFSASIIRMSTDIKNSGKHGNFLFLTGLSIALYFIYRVILFSGLGGYVQEGKGLNPVIPFKFLSAILFPFTNVFPDWTFSFSFILTSAAIISLVIIAYRTHRIPSGKVERIYLHCAVGIFVLGLATTIPHANMRLENIMGHSESRFTLMPVAGLSLILGIAAINYIRSVKAYKLTLIIILLWSLISAWRGTVQIQAWRYAGQISNSIITEALRIAPDPPKGSKMLFFQIPLSTDQHAYIFGIGLKEAIQSKYPGRKDITVLGRAKKSDLKQANPDNDYVFVYNKKAGRLERLLPDSGK
ncbi:hypothetical protein ACFL2X_02825 [Candidatus Latescibacterota bacterium]